MTPNRYSYEADGKVIGFYELNQMPGCNQVVVSNHAWIAPAYRSGGHGQHAHEQRLEEARRLGYDYIQCTVKATNVHQIAILAKNGWKQLDIFSNRETGNQVEIWGKRLNE